MYQLRALIWRAYKVRLRSTLTSLFDFLGPIIVMTVYLIIKRAVDQTPQNSDFDSSVHLFRNVTSKGLDPKASLQRFTCNKMPFYCPQKVPYFEKSLGDLCGLELVRVESREMLMEKLQKSLDSRIGYRQPNTNLNRPNSTSGCLSIPGASEPIYQVGLAIDDKKTFEIIMTDSIGTTVIFQPYHPGSSYNEYKFAQSDLNNGMILLEACLSNVVINYPELQLNQSVTNVTNATAGSDGSSLQRSKQEIKWRHKPFPTTTAPIVPVLLFILCYLVACLCNSLAAIIRVADERESGFHQYIRASGVSAFSYWISHVIVMTIHMAVQSLILAVMLAIPAGTNLLDPMYSTNISIRWMLLFSYSIAICVHSIFLGLFIDKQSHAILAITLQATSYALHFFVIHQYNAYGYTYFHKAADLMLWTPPPLFALLMLTSMALYLQTDAPLSWSQMTMGVVGGGITDRSFGDLWLQLVLQAILWLLLAIIIDELNYVPTYTPLGLFRSLLRCLCCCFNQDNSPNDTRTKTSSKAVLDPSRICCSIRHVSVAGPTGYTAKTKGDPFRLAASQLSAKTPEKLTSKTYQLHLKGPGSASTRSSSLADNQTALDDTIEQHIVWSRTRLGFDKLCLDFRFNQITFVLGQPDLKELLFASLLGLHPISSGYVLIDGAKFGPSAMGQARQLIGYLGERDIFLNELTIVENLRLFGSLRDPSYSEFDSESEFLLGLLHLAKRKDSRPVVLTQRSARKLALASAAVGRTKLLLLVEPTLSLRWKPRCQVLNLLKKYKSIRSIVVDTSDIDEAVAFGDRLLFFREGHTDLDGSPSYLERTLACGHRILLKPQQDSQRSMADNARHLDALTGHLFGPHKLSPLRLVELDDGSPMSGSHSSRLSGRVHGGRQAQPALVLKVQYSSLSTDSLIRLLKMFDNDANVHQFRLLEIRHESLEDIIVNRMSKAVYPNLPPDLLLSLTHRNEAIISDQEDSSQFGLRKLISNFPVPRTRGSIYNSSCGEILCDRLSTSREILIYLASLALSLLIVATVLGMLKSSLRPDYFILDQSRQDSDGPTQFVDPHTGAPIVHFSMLEQAYRNQVGLIIMDSSGAASRMGPPHSSPALVSRRGSAANSSSSQAIPLSPHWLGNMRISGPFSSLNSSKSVQNPSDSYLIASLINDNKGSVASVIFFDPSTGDASIVFEPNAPRILAYSIKVFTDYRYSLSMLASAKISNGLKQSLTNIPMNGNYSNRNNRPKVDGYSIDYADKSNAQVAAHARQAATTTATTAATTATTTSDTKIERIKLSQHSFIHPWHEMIRGYLTRRFHYAVAFSFAEGLTLGCLLVAPTRHRSESAIVRIHFSYWLAMALFDLLLALVQICGYVTLVVLIEGTSSASLVASMFLVFIIYKIAILPFAYLISMIIESTLKGWLFVMIFIITNGWIFGLQLRAFLEWTIINLGYSYTLIDWLLILVPINGLIDCLTNINHIHRMDQLCSQVPAYTATRNIVELDGPQSDNLNDLLVAKLTECLANGKTGISTNVYNQQKLGILSAIFLNILFGIIIWLFLLFSERVFGILTRRFSTRRASLDPMKTIIRSSEPTNSIFKWHKEKDRLVSEYMKCIHEPKYVRTMSQNCFFLRIWLKLMSDHRSAEKRLAFFLEPLTAIGLTRNDVRVELKTTLQVFIRLGSETATVKSRRVMILEAYAKLVKANADSIAKFALVDWTQEALYEILLHGHYNIRSTSQIP